MNNVTDEMVNRFLTWALPIDFMPDCGVSFTRMNHPTSWPTGTNLLTAHQARAMLEHVVGAAAPAAPAYVPLSESETDKLFFEHFSGSPGFLTIVDQRRLARAIESLVVARMRGEGK